MAILCAVATIPFLKQDAVCRVVAKLRTHNKKLLESPSTWTTGMIVGGIALMASVKALLIPRLDNVIAIIFLLCVIFGVLKALRQAVKETKAVRDTHRDNPKMQIDQWQMQLVVIFLLPIIAARAISILLSAASTAPDALRWCGAGLLTSGVLLLMLKPKISCFIGVCRTCKHPVPIVFVEFGSCPRCDETLLEKIETSAR